jgi:hypothetical protein
MKKNEQTAKVDIPDTNKNITVLNENGIEQSSIMDTNALISFFPVEPTFGDYYSFARQIRSGTQVPGRIAGTPFPTRTPTPIPVGKTFSFEKDRPAGPAVSFQLPNGTSVLVSAFRIRQLHTDLYLTISDYVSNPLSIETDFEISRNTGRDIDIFQKFALINLNGSLRLFVLNTNPMNVYRMLYIRRYGPHDYRVVHGEFKSENYYKGLYDNPLMCIVAAPLELEDDHRGQ